MFLKGANMGRNAAAAIFFYTLNVVLFLGFAAQTVSGDSMDKNNNGKSLYYYSFANRQLNSLIDTSTAAAGKKVFAIRLLKDKHKNYSIARELFFLNDSILVMDCRYTFVWIDLKRKKIIEALPKDMQSLIIIEKGKINYFQGGLLFNIDFSDIPNEKGLFIHGIGQDAIMNFFLFQEDDKYIVGVNNPRDENFIYNSFNLSKHPIDKIGTIWDLEYNDFSVMPALTLDDKIVVCQNKIMRIINTDGEIVKIIEGDFIPLSLSVGSDNLIYMLCKDQSDFVLKVMNLNGKLEWGKKVSVYHPNQPPIVSKKSKVYIIGSAKIEAFAQGQKLWEYALGTSEYSQKATVMADETVLIADNNRIIHLNEFGQPIWIYKDGQGLPFTCQPIVDSTGNIYACTDESIICIK
jgi:hypothetical protein